ncbi:MAG: LPS export ABC transporter periplasmic protein LptC [Muribaculaceae bacterium]|nr:LPS export ABC transporter periplasmic protein LptC [Muribaculaceae bacterium]
MRILCCRGRLLPILTIALILLAGACREEVKVNVASGIDTSKMPTMRSRNISTLISDSGITQYRIVAPLWDVYDNIDEPYWKFPEGIYLRKYDRKLKVIATIAADSATFFRNRNLWRLDGRVEVTKEPKELFQSPQVFWDQNKGIVYGDSFIHIENATHMMEGYGFTARQDFSGYRINKPLGIFPVDRDNIKSGGDGAHGQPAGGNSTSGNPTATSPQQSAPPPGMHTAPQPLHPHAATSFVR